jgi:MFS family permease
MGDLEKEVRDIFSTTKNPDSIEQQLLQKGYMKEDIDKAINSMSGTILTEQKDRRQAAAKKFFIKEIFDRIGYGFGSEQYINILFLLSGASYFLIAIVNGIKSILSSFLSSFLRDYIGSKGTSKRLLSYSGMAFGLSFILMAIATIIGSVGLFVASLLLGVVGVVAYGEFYQFILKNTLRVEKRGQIAGIYKYGLIITVISLLIGAFIMDYYNVLSFSFSLFGKTISMRLFGYFIVFEIAALFFMLAGFTLSRIDEPGSNMSLRDFANHVPSYIRDLKADMSTLMKRKFISLLIISGSLTGMVQILGNSFYGIFIYDHFKYLGFGGFLNVAMVSILALVVSLFTPLITNENAKAYGKYPMLIFGTVLMAIMPLTFYYNPNLVSIGMGTILGVTGAAIVGIANGMLSAELMPKDMKGDYFNAYTMLTIMPYIITVPLGAFLVHTVGISKMLLFLAIILLALVVPIYFVMMLFPRMDTQNETQKKSA